MNDAQLRSLVRKQIVAAVMADNREMFPPSLSFIPTHDDAVDVREGDWYHQIPVGHATAVCRILLRSPKQPWWMDRERVAVALRSYGRKRPYA